MRRIRSEVFKRKVMDAHQAAALINPGDNIGFSGFTGSGYPKALPGALAERITAAHQAGQEFAVGVFTGASTAPGLDGVLADAAGVAYRTPYQSDPTVRAAINAGATDYVDEHLSHLAPKVRQGFVGPMDWAVIEVTAINADGSLVPSSSLGNNLAYMQSARQIILEVNEWMSLDLEGMHDVYLGIKTPPFGQPIPITAPGDRIGSIHLPVDPDNVVAVVPTNATDRNTPFKPLDQESQAIAAHLIDFLSNEVKHGRLPRNLLPLQSGVGNIANAVTAGLLHSDFEQLASYTEVIQDGMLDLLDSGKMTVASATAFSLSPEAATRMNQQASYYRDRVVLRSQELSNSPELIRRLGVISCNALIEADIYGNVNSTHIMGSKMQNGIGGSGDFTRNAYISTFVTPSVAKGGAISCIVPMVTHVDHTEHDVQIIITEQGVADLRRLAPRQRARSIIANCAHPDYRAGLEEYLAWAEATAISQHTPHDLAKAFSWHERFIQTGTMRPTT
ncbi:MAG: acetyl-CoA hydrolase/transferase family protein [Micrococcales bacterium]|nr:acetyl-CoA hydrolase/transferase family protein [Micrococcales bacterium]